MVLNLRETARLIRHPKNSHGQVSSMAKASLFSCAERLPVAKALWKRRRRRPIESEVMISSGPLQNATLRGGEAGLSPIAGQGEMAELVRHCTWEKTPLGAMEGWPQELLACVNMTLASPLPARTLWGRELILIYNDAYRQFPGKRHPEALGMSAREVYRDSWHVVGPILEEAFAAGRGFHHAGLCVPLPGEKGPEDHFLNYTSVPIFQGGQVAGLFGTLHDVTEEVIALRRLREKEAQTERILQSIGDAVIVTDAEARVVRMNPVAESLTGWWSSEAAGRPLGGVFRLVDEGTRAPVETLAEKIRRRPVVFSGGQQALLVSKSGAEMAVENNGAPILDDEGNLTGIVLVFRNVDERRRTESALLKSEKLAAVGRLASSIAHEINNPLESVMNLIYLARHSEGEDSRRYLDLADEEIRRVSIIANQTLRFRKQASSPQAATANDLFSTVMSIYEGRLKNARVAVERRFRAREPVVCFQGDVRQVLNNLVSNALEAMPFGGRLLIRSRAGRNWKTGERGLVLTIADNGSGIPPEVRKHIFDAFFTTKGTAGNGLGLWVSQEIVERHHGVLRVRSTQREGRSGTTFTLFLPFEPPADTEAIDHRDRAAS
ncbi:PAS domain S-box protein [Acidobacteria bacterium AB60]|nr:PAS domain S-box protein [Acidobacteria bacterium AB60]